MTKQLYIIDIETECAVPNCPGGAICKDKEKHALNPHTNRITDVGVMQLNDPSNYSHYTSLDEFNFWLDNNTGVGFVGHHIKFDFRSLITHGAALTVEDIAGCTEIMAHVLTDKVSDVWLTQYELKRQELNKELPVGKSHRKAGKHSLKTTAPYFCGVDPFWEQPGDYSNPEYLFKDVDYTRQLYIELGKRLKAKSQYEFYERELDYSRMLVEAELTGVPVNTQELARIKENYRKMSFAAKQQLDELWSPAYQAYYDIQVQKLKDKYQTMYAKRREKVKDAEKLKTRYEDLLAAAVDKLEKGINFNSDKQMLWLIRDYLGLEAVNYEGKESTSKEVLKGLARQGRQDIELYLTWRKCEKVLSSYIPAYERLIHKGRLHPTFNITSTRTGRLSSSDPNLQQVPKELKPMFKADPDTQFVGYDYSGVEAKVINYYTGDPALYEIDQNGYSIHNYNAKNWLNLDCEIEEVKDKYPQVRQAVKNMGFALFYGAGVNRIEGGFKDAGLNVPRSECETIKKRFVETYKTAKKFHRDLTKLFEQGNIVPNLLGRPIAIENPEDAYMKGFNTLVQSSASDIMLEAAYQARRRFQEEGLAARIHLFVHDFVQVEAPLDEIERVDKILVEEMTKFKLVNNVGQTINLTIDGGIASVWE